MPELQCASQVKTPCRNHHDDDDAPQSSHTLVHCSHTFIFLASAHCFVSASSLFFYIFLSPCVYSIPSAGYRPSSARAIPETVASHDDERGGTIRPPTSTLACASLFYSRSLNRTLLLCHCGHCSWPSSAAYPCADFRRIYERACLVLEIVLCVPTSWLECYSNFMHLTI